MQDNGNMKKFLIVLPALLALQPVTAGASPTERTEFETWCRQGTASASGACLAYLLAARDVLAQDSIEGVRACLPDEVKLAELQRIAQEWLVANPAARSASALGLVARAYAARFPCAAQK